MGTRALVAVAEPVTRGLLCLDLRQARMQVLEAATGGEALSMLRRAGLDAALLDVDLPEIDGLELVSRVRRESTVPIILLTARIDATLGVAGLEAGADDYVVLPCAPGELAARTRAVIRRARSFEAHPTILRSGTIELDLDDRRCYRDGCEVALTHREFELLAALLRQEGRIHSRSELLALVWGGEAVRSRTIDVHVASLRRKLGAAITIKTLRGVGYRLDPEPHVPLSGA